MSEASEQIAEAPEAPSPSRALEAVPDQDAFDQEALAQGLVQTRQQIAALKCTYYLIKAGVQPGQHPNQTKDTLKELRKAEKAHATLVELATNGIDSPSVLLDAVPDIAPVMVAGLPPDGDVA